MKVQGRVIREDLGPGVFLLETRDGTRYALKGGDDALFKEGRVVSVQGKLESDVVGIGMTGAPVLAVDSYSVID